MDIQNSDWFTGGPWCNIPICNKLHGKLFEGFIINARTNRYNIIFLLMHMKNIINNLDVMMASAVGVVHYQQLQRQKHYNRLV